MTASTDRSLRCAFLSCDSLDDYVVDDDRAYPAFAAAGLAAERVSWRDSATDWNAYDAVIVRSTWDYVDDVNAFFDVLAEIERSRAKLANPLEVMRWNAHKTYLRDLQSRGVAVVPTRWGDTLDGAGLARLANAFGTRRWVIKPIVGANAAHTYALDSARLEVRENAVLESFGDRPWMAQPFMDSVTAEGEFSLFYFRDALSHAILKTPERGDFRVQEEHGGSIRAITPEAALRGAGDLALRALPGGLLYARVDLVRDGPDFRVMEVELIEPSLYLRMDADSPRRFASAVRDWLEGGWS